MSFSLSVYLHISSVHTFHLQVLRAYRQIKSLKRESHPIAWLVMNSDRVLLVKFSILAFPFRQVGFGIWGAHQGIEILSVQTEDAGHVVYVFSSACFAECEFSDERACFEVEDLAAFASLFDG